MPETTTVVPFGRPIRDLRSALEELTALEAVLTVATDRKAKIRTYLETADDAIRKAMQTGDGYAHEVPGIGTVTVTSPNRKPQVTDRDAFVAWAIRTYPDSIETREILEPRAIEEALDGKLGDDVRTRLLDVLDEIPGALTVQTYLPETFERDLLKPARSVVLEGDDGSTTVVVKDTGERIPGLEAPYASTPACRPKPDPDLLEKFVASLTDRLPEIETDDA